MKEIIRFQDQSVHLLTHGAAAVRIAPQAGARLLDWRVNGREVIHWPAEADWSTPAKIRGGNPILFPFLGRHFVDGAIGRWRDAAGTVRDLPMHGFARDLPFTVVEESDPDTLRMRLEESEQTRAWYPFAFRFEVAYRLGGTQGDTLEAEFATTNTGDQPLPYYAGHHFYFALDHRDRAHWKLDLPFAQTGTQAPDGSILMGNPPASAATLDQPELIDRFQIAPTASRFSLADQRDGNGPRIEFDLAPRETVPWYAVTTWTLKPESDFYCVEPWLGLPNAIGHGLGLRWLAPGVTERAVCSLRYRPGT